MTLEEFAQRAYEEAEFNSSYDGISLKEAYINYVTEIMMDAEEIDDFNYLYFEGFGKHNKSIRIDGYSYSELDECLNIFVCTDISYGQEGNLTQTKIKEYFQRAVNFVTEASYIIETCEESSPGYGLAYDIINRYKNIKRYRFYIITDMPLSLRVKNVKSGDINGIEVNYNVWDIKRIYELFESSQTKEDITIDIKKYEDNGIPCLLANSSDDYYSYLCNVPGTLLANIYNEYGSRLLEGNVRSFLQLKGKVNKSIRNTILNEPTMFFAYNNGIAGTASEVNVENVEGQLYITSIKALQIVNGGQTTASLARALLKDKKDGSVEKIKQVFVPMKLSVVNSDKASDMIPNIARFANSQNKISESDLFSNHPFHIRLEKISRSTIAPAVDGKQYGTYWYYERAAGQYRQETYKMKESEKKKFEEKNPPKQMFKKTDLAKYWNVWNLKPHIASKGGQTAFGEFAMYISKQWTEDETIFNKVFFQNIVSIIIIWKNAERIVKNQSWFNSYRANIVAYTISMIFNKVKTDYSSFAIDLNSIWQNQNISKAWEEEIIFVSKLAYDHLTNDDREVENVTEWAKREACWDSAKKIRFNLNSIFLKELIDLDTQKNTQKQGKKDQKLMNGIEAQTFVYNYGVDKWKKLVEWNSTHHVLSPVELEFVNVAISIEKNRIPSEKQCPKIIQILNKARENGYPY